MEIGTWRGSFCIHGGGGGQDSWYLFDEKRNAKLVAVLPWDVYGKGGNSVIIDDNIYWTGGCRRLRGRISWLFPDLIRHNISDDDPSSWEVVARSRIPRAMPFLAALDKNRILVLAGEELPNNNDVSGADWNKAGDIYHLDSKMWEYMNAEMTDFQLFRTIHASRFSGGIVFYCVFTGSMLFVTTGDDGGLTLTNNELGPIACHKDFALHRITEKERLSGLEHCEPKSLATSMRFIRGIYCNDTLSWLSDDLRLYRYSRFLRRWTWSYLGRQLPPISQRVGSHPILVDPMLRGGLDQPRCLVVITEMDKFTIASISDSSVVSIREFPLADPSFRPYGAVYGPCYNFDLFVIGADSGVMQAAKLSAKFGARVAICDFSFRRINSDERILLDGSAYGPEVEDARNYGWEVHEGVNFNWRRLQQKKTEGIVRWGKVIGPNEVEVIQQNGTKISYLARHILIATGSKAARPEIPGQELAITPDEAMSLEELPKHVVIIGEGYTAVEFASIWRGMGATVDLCFRNELPLSGFDDEMRAVVARNLEGRGIKLHRYTVLTKLEKSGDVIKVHLYSNAILADVVLFATGGLPNTERLNLDAVGVELDKMKAVKVDEYSRTNVPSIWAIGDVTSRKNLTRVDYLMEGTSFAKTVFNGKPTKLDYSHIPCAVFCTPPLSVVGLSEEQAVEQVTGAVSVYTSKFNPVKNTITGRQEEAVLKVLVDKMTKRILGASMCGPDAPEIMQRIAIALKCGMTKEQFDSVGIQPSAAEEFFTMTIKSRLRVSHDIEPTFFVNC